MSEGASTGLASPGKKEEGAPPADEGPSDRDAAVRERVAAVRAVCGLRDDARALELLEAATGSVEGAVQIHLDCAEAGARGAARAAPRVEAGGSARSGDPPRRSPAAAVQSRKTEASSSARFVGDANERKKQRQGTLDSFLGLPEAPKKNDPQTRIEQFFRPRRPPNAAALPSARAPERRNDGSAKQVRGGGDSHDPTRPSSVGADSVSGDSPPRGEPLPEPGNASNLPLGRSPPAVASAARASKDQGADASPEAINLCSSPSPSAASSSSTPSTYPMEVDAPYHWVSETLASMSDTAKRTAKLAALSSLFLRLLRHLKPAGGVDAGEIVDGEGARHNRAVYVFTCAVDLVLGKLSILKGASAESFAPTDSTPLQVSGSTVSSAVQTVTGATRAQLRQAYRASGDLGDCAAQYFQPLSSMKRFFAPSDSTPSSKQTRNSSLTVTRVHETLEEIAVVAVGKGSQRRRQDLIVKLLRSTQDKAEVRFLVRTLLGNMRLGATIKSVVTALARAVVEARSEGPVPGDSVLKDASEALQKVFNVCPSLDRIVGALLTGGITYAVEHCTVEVFHPIQPMLANPAHSLDEVQQLMVSSPSRTNASEWAAVAEWKYDGVRCQAHFDGATVKLYSRNLIENTRQYPDAVEYMLQATTSTVTSFIIDSELVAVSPSAQARDGFSLLPFQDLSTRRGGHKQGTSRGTPAGHIQIRIYAFDLIYLNGESLLQLPLGRRQELLQIHFVASDGFGFATSVPIPRYDKALLESTLEASVRDGAEGLMIKLTGQCGTSESGCIADQLAREFGYEPGTRGQLWLKLKRDYLTGEVGGSTTIDVVPVGAWFGTGRKAKNGFLSPVLLAVYDDDEGIFYSIARCMTFSDEMYAAMRDYYFYGTPYPDRVGLGESEGEIIDDSVRASETGEGDNSQSGKVDAASSGQDDFDAPTRVNCLDVQPSWVVTNESPPIWFKPSEVFEVAFADLSLSTSHTSASTVLGERDGRGVALRFPRFKRRRPDKSVDQATTPDEIARLFFQQSKVKSVSEP